MRVFVYEKVIYLMMLMPLFSFWTGILIGGIDLDYESMGYLEKFAFLMLAMFSLLTPFIITMIGLVASKKYIPEFYAWLSSDIRRSKEINDPTLAFGQYLFDKEKE